MKLILSGYLSALLLGRELQDWQADSFPKILDLLSINSWVKNTSEKPPWGNHKAQSLPPGHWQPSDTNKMWAHKNVTNNENQTWEVFDG